VQNMVLATRALGLGTTLTTRHLLYEKEAEAALGLPPGVHSYAILPIGYPMGKFGPVGRGPLKEFVYQDRWGQSYAGVCRPPASVGGLALKQDSAGSSGFLQTRCWFNPL